MKDTKEADLSVCNDYSMCSKVKNDASEEIFAESTFDKQADEINFRNENLSNPLFSPVNEIDENNKRTSRPSDIAENINSWDNLPLSSSVNLKKAWGQHLNTTCKNVKKNQPAITDKLSSFQLSQNISKSFNFSKRNPRKSLPKLSRKSKMKSDTCPNELSKEELEPFNDPGPRSTSYGSIEPSFCRTEMLCTKETKKALTSPAYTIQQLSTRYTKMIHNRQLNRDWITQRMTNIASENNLSVHKSFKSNSEVESTIRILSSQESISAGKSDNKSYVDDEDYICSSDFKDKRKNKRVRNFEKSTNVTDSQPTKRICFLGDQNIPYEIKPNNRILKGQSLEWIGSNFSSDIVNLSNCFATASSINVYQSENVTDSLTEQVKDEASFIIAEKDTSRVSEQKFSACQKKEVEQLSSITNSRPLQDLSNKKHVDENGKKSAKKENVHYSTDSVESPKVEPCATDSGIASHHSATSKMHTSKHGRLNRKPIVRNLNENFVRIDIKKKSYSRGKKSFTYSKYKKNQWKGKQISRKPDTKDNDIALLDYIDKCNGLLCFKCKEPGHYAKQCPKVYGNDFDAKRDFHHQLSLQETEKITNANAASHKSIETHPGRAAGSVSSKLNSKCTKEKSVKSSGAKREAKGKKKNMDGGMIAVQKASTNVIDNLLTNQTQEIHSLYEFKSDSFLKGAPPEVLGVLRKFGHSNFRDGQERAIMRILSGQSTLVILATGSGKSLCYQLPAYMFAKQSKCITLVISPLVSLMDDQVFRIPEFLTAACLHSNQSPKLQLKVLEKIRKHELNILLVSPEFIMAREQSGRSGGIFDELPPIAFACIDEVHCISQWSHNFRPSYLMVCKILKESLGVKTILGLTATASKPTMRDISNLLNIPDGMEGVISESSVPCNLSLTVSRDAQREEALIRLLGSDKFVDYNSIIIYCTRREECVRVAGILQLSLRECKLGQDYAHSTKLKISPIAEAYHAGLSAHRRKIVQAAFMTCKTRIIVATTAFGMGINKSNIRSVIHFNMPATFEGYVQEIGRAGRDGLPAHCHLFLCPNENADEYELRRHINADRIDRYTIGCLLKKIFRRCNCLIDTGTVQCPRHEVAFAIDETVKTLDISEEMITTLLCYLDLQPKHFIDLLSPVYINAKIRSYSGPFALKKAAESSLPLTSAIGLLKKNKTYHEDSCILEFSVIDIASMIGWDSGQVKNQLKSLEWIKENDMLRPSEISVQFSTLGFRVKAPGDLTNNDIDEALESLSQQCNSRTMTCFRKLHLVSTVFRNHSFASVQECLNKTEAACTKSEELKSTIYTYFEQDDSLSSCAVLSAGTKADKDNDDINQTNIVSDIRNLIFSYSGNRFTGQSVARIFHGIQSPNYPAFVWSRCRFWRAYLTEDFDTICQLATKEILKM